MTARERAHLSLVEPDADVERYVVAADVRGRGVQADCEATRVLRRLAHHDERPSRLEGFRELAAIRHRLKQCGLELATSTELAQNCLAWTVESLLWRPDRY